MQVNVMSSEVMETQLCVYMSHPLRGRAGWTDTLTHTDTIPVTIGQRELSAQFRHQAVAELQAWNATAGFHSERTFGNNFNQRTAPGPPTQLLTMWAMTNYSFISLTDSLY